MATEIDVIILSYAHTEELRKMTLECVETLLASESTDIQFNVIVIESEKTCPEYPLPQTRTIFPTQPFGYHRYLNIGLRESSAPFIAFCNNDLLFKPGWATAILEAAKKYPDLMSFSMVDPWLHERFENFKLTGDVMRGYEKMKFFTGWCFLTRREIFQQIGEFDEKFEFWYCDDDVIKTYQKFGIQHALVTQSIVKHIGSTTLNKIEDRKERQRLTDHQFLYFDYKWNHKSKLIYSIKYLRMKFKI